MLLLTPGVCFGAALRAALPHVPPAEIAWRFLFMVGAMAYAAGQGELVERFGQETGPAPEPEPMIERLVAFLVAGMGAPAGATRQRER